MIGWPIGARSGWGDTQKKRDRGLVRAFDLTSDKPKDKRNDIYFATVTALFVISDKRRLYIRWDLVRGDPVRLDVVALIGRELRSFGPPPPPEEEEEEEEFVQRPRRFSHSAKIPEVRLLLSSLSLLHL